MLRTVYALLLVMAVVLFITQILWPVWHSRPIFPLFRRGVARREALLVEAADTADDAAIREEAARLGDRSKPTS